ncbi:ECF transporter S component [Corynebacterium oculi]|uniref:Putative HMP/thiamine permease protein YkoE n=1 Tax=Corynebacterium oculi TaxID=1544416 RepID=A0A0Q0YML4_9CORY|nr:ECF transporter S component [Corynebacterium oculi]KQB83702.1 putative HMP/thiamine permease protein YkoE [Corynebacterium oculi]
MAKSTSQWRVVDIVVAAILGLACGLIFVVWNSAGALWLEAMNALTPGLGGLATGVWLLGGVIGGLVIRKPGSALFTELLAAVASALLGSQWGASTVYSGLAQGLGAELIFALFAYRSFRLPTAMLAGVGAGIGVFILELFTAGHLARSLEYNAIYLVCLMISGALLAGALGYGLVRALARTGALDRFAAGREVRGTV